MTCINDRPRNCDGRDGCTCRRHKAYARLMDALAEARAAMRAIEELPLPRGVTGPREEWFLDERQTHQIILEDIAGLRWGLNYFVCVIESITLSCCFSQVRRTQLEADMRQAAQAYRASKAQAVPELAAQEGTKPALAVLATA